MSGGGERRALPAEGATGARPGIQVLKRILGGLNGVVLLVWGHPGETRVNLGAGGTETVNTG